MREFNQHTTILDRGFKIRKEKCKSDIRANFFGNRIASLWNTLPADTVKSPCTNTLKNSLEKPWMQYQFTADIQQIPSRTNSNPNLIEF